MKFKQLLNYIHKKRVGIIEKGQQLHDAISCPFASFLQLTFSIP